MGSLAIDHIGQRFERWLVLKRGETEANQAYWLCRCDCGSESEVPGQALRRGNSKGCRECAYPDRTGERYGKWLVIRRGRKREQQTTLWACRCDCGTERDIPFQSLQHGFTKQCDDCRLREVTVVDRICRWCGHPSGEKEAARCCMACQKTAARRGRFPCYKPRRPRPPANPPLDEHHCSKCKPWPTA